MEEQYVDLNKFAQVQGVAATSLMRWLKVRNLCKPPFISRDDEAWHKVYIREDIAERYANRSVKKKE